MTAKKKGRAKKAAVITLIVTALLVLLTLPYLFFPENEVLYYIAYGPLTILYGLFFLFMGLVVILFILFCINAFHGGYTDSGWKAMGLSALVCLAMIFGIGFLLGTADFVPFSDQPFSAPLFSDIFTKKVEIDGCTYSLKQIGKNRTATLVSYKKPDGQASRLVIPSAVEGLPVTKIENSVFNANETAGLETIVLPDSIESTGKYTFSGCSTVTIVAPKKASAYGADSLFGHWSIRDCGWTGDTVKFGRYEQDGFTEDGPEPIVWFILRTDGDRKLLLSRDILARQPYGEGRNRSWEESKMKDWLNTIFAAEAFTPEERERITSAGVFLVSEADVNECLPNREAYLTSYAFMAEDGISAMCSWMLLDENGDALEVSANGKYINLPGQVFGLEGVRPAIWVTGLP